MRRLSRRKKKANPPSPDVVRLILSRYVVHEEDDGLGGNGSDLYVGYLLSGAVGQGGATSVRGGLTNSNGGNPRNTHDVQQALFTVPLPPAGQDGEFAVARLYLIESDQTTGLIQQAFSQAVVPNFTAIAPPTITAADLPLFYLVPFAPIVKLLGQSNTDDDYGHWDLILFSQSGTVGFKAMGATPESSANPSWAVIAAGSKTQLVLTYVDADNDIDCVIDVSLSYSAQLEAGIAQGNMLGAAMAQGDIQRGGTPLGARRATPTGRKRPTRRGR